MTNDALLRLTCALCGQSLSGWACADFKDVRYFLCHSEIRDCYMAVTVYGKTLDEHKGIRLKAGG